MMISAARAQLEAIKTDAQFLKSGIEIYMEILGYEHEIEWLQKAIAARMGEGSSESD